MLIDLT